MSSFPRKRESSGAKVTGSPLGRSSKLAFARFRGDDIGPFCNQFLEAVSELHAENVDRAFISSDELPVAWRRCRIGLIVMIPFCRSLTSMCPPLSLCAIAPRLQDAPPLRHVDKSSPSQTHGGFDGGRSSADPIRVAGSAQRDGEASRFDRSLESRRRSCVARGATGRRPHLPRSAFLAARRP